MAGVDRMTVPSGKAASALDQLPSGSGVTESTVFCWHELKIGMAHEKNGATWSLFRSSNNYSSEPLYEKVAVWISAQKILITP